MIDKKNNYPARCRRNQLIGNMALDMQNILAGRVVRQVRGNEEIFFLQDDTGQVRFEKSTYDGLKPGDIVECKGHLRPEAQGNVFVVREAQVLVPFAGDAFHKEELQANWQRCLFEPKAKKRLRDRARIVRAIRDFFYERGFIEAETPTLVAQPGMEPYLTPFRTDLDLSPERDQPAYLITSPEYSLKKYLAGGFERIFELTRSFRNGEIHSAQHNPEFTILEWYRAYASYIEIMEDTEQLVDWIARTVLGKTYISYQNIHIDLSSPWERLRFKDALERYAGIKYEDVKDLKGMRKMMARKGYHFEPDTDRDTLLLQLVLNEVEPHLGRGKPTILYDYPVSMAALSKVSESDPRFAERFEVYIAGLELCNAFTELNDWQEQNKRLLQEQKTRRQLAKEAYPVDSGFIEALQWGLPPSGGIALGVDRLVMLLLDSPRIRDVIWVPWQELFGRLSS